MQLPLYLGQVYADNRKEHATQGYPPTPTGHIVIDFKMVVNGKHPTLACKSPNARMDGGEIIHLHEPTTAARRQMPSYLRVRQWSALSRGI